MRKSDENTRAISNDTTVTLNYDDHMVKEINGVRYDFRLEFEDVEGEVAFGLRAICRESQRTSCINNLNAILSLLHVSSEYPEFEDSEWVVGRSRAARFRKLCMRALSDNDHVSLFETCLDDDRSCGEWANLWIAEKTTPSD